MIVTKFKSLLIANDCLCHASAYACLASELRYETSVRSAKYSARNAASLALHFPLAMPEVEKSVLFPLVRFH